MNYMCYFILIKACTYGGGEGPCVDISSGLQRQLFIRDRFVSQSLLGFRYSTEIALVATLV